MGTRPALRRRHRGLRGDPVGVAPLGLAAAEPRTGGAADRAAVSGGGRRTPRNHRDRSRRRGGRVEITNALRGGRRAGGRAFGTSRLPRGHPTVAAVAVGRGRRGAAGRSRGSRSPRTGCGGQCLGAVRRPVADDRPLYLCPDQSASRPARRTPWRTGGGRGDAPGRHPLEAAGGAAPNRRAATAGGAPGGRGLRIYDSTTDHGSAACALRGRRPPAGPRGGRLPSGTHRLGSRSDAAGVPGAAGDAAAGHPRRHVCAGEGESGDRGGDRQPRARGGHARRRYCRRRGGGDPHASAGRRGGIEARAGLAGSRRPRGRGAAGTGDHRTR